MKTCAVKAHVRSVPARRVPSKPQAYLDKHAELRRELDELRIDAMGELLADALLLSIAEEEAR